MSTPADNIFDDVQDPQDVQNAVSNQDEQAVQNARSWESRSLAVANQGFNSAANGLNQATGNPNIGDPRVVQARKISDAMRSILTDVTDSAPPDEDPVDRNLRIAQQVSARMADISPQLALKANLQAVTMQEAKNQQARITAQTQQEQVKTDEAKIEGSYQVHGVQTGKDGLPNFVAVGDPVSLYNADGTKNSNFNQDIQANLALAKQQGLSSPQFTTTDKFNSSKLAVQMARGQNQMAVQQQKDRDAAALKQAAADVPEETIKYYAGQTALLGNGALSRQPPALRNAVTAYKAAAGLQPADEVMAQAEIAGLKSGERAIGTRAGNTAILQNELTGLGQNIQTTLANVDRTRIPAVNAMLRAGNTAGLSPGPEAAYAAAIQAFTTAHGRLIAGATGGVTSDAARDQAMSLVTGTQAPEAVKSAINQIVNQEVPVIRSASDGAISMMANRNKYPGINKISQRLGYSLDTLVPPTPGTLPQEPPVRTGQQAPAYATPEDVKAAYKAGKLTREQAKAELMQNHGMQ